MTVTLDYAKAGVSNTPELLADVTAAAAAAAAAEEAAEIAEAAAQSSEDDAEAAQLAAEEARDNAEQYQIAAEAAADAAEGFADDAEGFATAAEAVQTFLMAYSRQVPTTGFTINISDSLGVLQLNPAGTLASGTINLPANPVDGQRVRIQSSEQITALTIGAGSNTLVDTTAFMPAQGHIEWQYSLSETSWKVISSSPGMSGKTAPVANLAVIPTAGAVTLQALGSDAHINVVLTPKGAGQITAGSAPFTCGTLIPSSISGVGTNSSAAAGRIGEIIEGTATAQSLTSGVAVSHTSITLTPGDWDVRAFAQFRGNTGTVYTGARLKVTTTSGGATGITTELDALTSSTQSAPGSEAPVVCISCGPSQVKVAAATTLDCFATTTGVFSVSTATVTVRIVARRMR